MKPNDLEPSLHGERRNLAELGDSTDLGDRGLRVLHRAGIEQRTADGTANHDWTLEKGMVVPLHLLVPGGERERYWLEEVVVITASGGRPLFSWGFGPLSGG